MTGRRARTPDIGVGRSDLLRRGVRSPVNGRNRLIPPEGAKALTPLGFASLRARLELASLVEAIFISRHEPKVHLNSLTLAVLCGGLIVGRPRPTIKPQIGSPRSAITPP